MIAPPHRTTKRGQRRVRFDRDAAPAREIERERDVVVNRMPGANVDVEAVLLPIETAPEMEVLEALRIGEGREGHVGLSAGHSGAAPSDELGIHHHKRYKRSQAHGHGFRNSLRSSRDDRNYLSNPYRLCSVRTASSVRPTSIKSENLISDVVIARMLIFFPARLLKACAATPAWLRMPIPITETLATSVEPSSEA